MPVAAGAIFHVANKRDDAARSEWLRKVRAEALDQKHAQEHDPMFHELLLAICFLAMIAAPAYVTSATERNRRDSR